MIKKYLAIAVGAVFALFSVASAAVTTFTPVGEGASNNDKLSNVLAVAGVPNDIVLLGKTEGNGTLTDQISGLVVNSFTSSGEDAKSGSFSFDFGNFNVTHFSVKASNTFYVFALDTPASSGMINWTTALLTNNGGNQPDMSHISLFGRQGLIVPPPDLVDEVPLPAAAPLFAGALAGFGVYRRRKARRQALAG